VAELLIPNMEETLLQQLRARASARGRSAEAEAKLILAEVLQSKTPDVWAKVNALCERLAASGRTFSDSAELLREDRER
jgi:plasmid stability protein